MSCPVVRAIDELYGSYEYGITRDTGIIGGTESELLTLHMPSGKVGGGTYDTEVRFETAKFYITVRKLQYARAELTGNEKHFERWAAGVRGKKSYQLLAEILAEPSRQLYLAVTRAIDIIDITEGVCCTVLARDFPSGMSLPTVQLDPKNIIDITAMTQSSSDSIHKIVSGLIDYAVKLSVGGVKAQIEPLPKFTDVHPANALRDFTCEGSNSELLSADMEVASHAYLLEQYQATAIARVSEVMKLCQKIVDLGCTDK